MWIRQPDSSLGSVHELVTLASEWAKVSQRPRSGHQIASIDRADWRHRTNADRWNVAPDRIGVTGSSAGRAPEPHSGHHRRPRGRRSYRPRQQCGPGCGRFLSSDGLLELGGARRRRGRNRQAGQMAAWLWRRIEDRRRPSDSRPSHVIDLPPQRADAPISIIHGDADPIVPLFQSHSFRKIAESKGVPIELVIKKGAKHGWPNKEADEVQFLNWFNRHLLN